MDPVCTLHKGCAPPPKKTLGSTIHKFIPFMVYVNGGGFLSFAVYNLSNCIEQPWYW